MKNSVEQIRSEANRARYVPGDPAGHYESYFLRANHPAKPQAFWLRYTVFSPAGFPDQAIGEVWAMMFDGASGHHVAAKSEHPIAQTTFDNTGLNVSIGDSVLKTGALSGSAATGDNLISWDLSYSGEAAPLLLLPENLYEAKLPKAKACVPLPFAVFSGSITVNDVEWRINEWVGSQNHNWGSKHTDLYAWGQVAGFDNAPDSFLEIGTARLKFGPVWTPRMTVIVLRHNGRDYALNTIPTSLRAKGRFGYFSWEFSSRVKGASVSGRIDAALRDFVGLTYFNPPGGIKHCLNSKLARCEVTLTTQDGVQEKLVTQNRAAFEILTDDRNHGVRIMV